VNRQLPGTSAALANALVLAVLVIWASLHTWFPGLYYGSVSEDAVLEWITFWSLALASVVFFIAAARQRRDGRFPWFLIGLGLFCFLFAMEEISWGQRLLGYQPPEYFLAENYQQELTLHNLSGRAFRNALFRATIAGYGVLLPLSTFVKPLARLLDRIGVVPPPLGLAPAFIAMLVLHLVYPWRFTGEIIEAALGLALMISALSNYHAFAGHATRPMVASLALASVTVVVLAAGSGLWYQNKEASDPTKERDAQAETAALKKDLIAMARRNDALPTMCGMHQRLYRYLERYEYAQSLTEGSFVELAGERGEYFIDPWNLPYWIRDTCAETTASRSIFVYSFGPNRRRDSTEWKILGDDIGSYLTKEPRSH
jgi:hypothetical protein